MWNYWPLIIEPSTRTRFNIVRVLVELMSIPCAKVWPIVLTIKAVTSAFYNYPVQRIVMIKKVYSIWQLLSSIDRYAWFIPFCPRSNVYQCTPIMPYWIWFEWKHEKQNIQCLARSARKSPSASMKIGYTWKHSAIPDHKYPLLSAVKHRFAQIAVDLFG